VTSVSLFKEVTYVFFIRQLPCRGFYPFEKADVWIFDELYWPAFRQAARTPLFGMGLAS